MRKVFLTLGLAVASLGLSVAQASAESFNVDTKNSTIVWVGKKVAGEHTGTLKFASGNVSVDGAKIAGASLVVDMNTINTTDLQGEWKEKLDGHLKAEDFFNVAVYPTAKLELVSISGEGAKALVKAKLTIKGITKELSFPATIRQQGSVFVAIADFKINRTDYGIKYGSKSFFDNLGDKTIDDEFELRVNLVAKK